MTADLTPFTRLSNEDRAALPGNMKVTREDWLRVALDLLVSDGVSEVKVLTIGNRLEVSRSSFYWYFKSRKDLLGQLLDEWERTNTGILVASTQKHAATITGAVCNFFRAIVDPDGFNYQLDFAVREWARRDGTVRKIIDRSDSARMTALSQMFLRFGYPSDEAEIRARVLYYQQIGYYALDLNETLEERLSRVRRYLYAFTGVEPGIEEVEEFCAFARDAAQR